MLASHLIDTIPSVMREWRKELHSGLPAGVSINQFRVLFFVDMGHRSSSYLAKHQGVSAAAMSKMIDSLVKKKWLKREANVDDRRQNTLLITKQGEAVLKRVRIQVEKRMQTHLDELSSSDQEKIAEAMSLLKNAFAGDEGKL